ncbi:MAG: phosphate ABC transporter substrate-binding protein PstS [Actinomycetaceae bacterium]|nr:phosphate ABC transporter substrate-binding protein PstS [Arcanobacterium sp.]MDD7504431.1 phosphate ABC transporter substrate-binding protein PstS [Actinomycetaceae bacterium]MDY6143689.1 phosphate ABC transporter substrate-binding protein PstS [Arcanobacterium sp.]
MKLYTGVKATALVCALSLTLAACGTSAGEAQQSAGNASATSATTSDTLNGSGATSQQNAQQAWRDAFTSESGVVVNYDPTGSGTGREQFIAGKVAYAGSDSAMRDDEIAAATARCIGQEPLELPLYISPIALAFNLEGIDRLDLDSSTIAKIFAGEITKWNDPAIMALNPHAALPDQAIIPVNRADDSGTTENFQQYLQAAAPDVWNYEPSDVWPIEGTQSAEKTSGVVNLVSSTPGAITYADASQIGDLGTVAVEVGDEFLPYSPEAAAAIVDGSSPAANATDRIQAVDLVRDGSIPGAYPIVMISYLIACTQYEDPAQATHVKDFLTYVASENGQDAATKAQGGNAPISDALREKVMTAIELIGA